MFDELYAHLSDDIFDLVIDDGLHAPNANIATMLFALKILRPSGFLIVEDIHSNSIPIWQVVPALLPENYSPKRVQAKSYRQILVTGGSGGSGLSLRSDDLDSVVELYTADDLRQLVVAAQTMPTLLRGLRELEDHSECGLVREATP